MQKATQIFRGQTNSHNRPMGSKIAYEAVGTRLPDCAWSGGHVFDDHAVLRFSPFGTHGAALAQKAGGVTPRGQNGI